MEDLPDAGAEWAIQQRELWGEKTQRIENVVEILLSKLRESCQVVPTMNPTEDGIPEGGGRKTVNNEELLIFKYADFKKLIEEKYPKVFYGDLREKLCEMGVMICHKKKLYYTINIGGKATNMSKKVYLTSDGFSYHTLELRYNPTNKAYRDCFKRLQQHSKAQELYPQKDPDGRIYAWRWGKAVVS